MCSPSFIYSQSFPAFQFHTTLLFVSRLNRAILFRLRDEVTMGTQVTNP